MDLAHEPLVALGLGPPSGADLQDCNAPIPLGEIDDRVGASVELVLIRDPAIGVKRGVGLHLACRKHCCSRARALPSRETTSPAAPLTQHEFSYHPPVPDPIPPLPLSMQTSRRDADAGALAPRLRPALARTSSRVLLCARRRAQRLTTALRLRPWRACTRSCFTCRRSQSGSSAVVAERHTPRLRQ